MFAKVLYVCALLFIFVSCGGQLQTWQDAYADLLRGHYNMSAYLYAEEAPLFVLHDIDGDGVPELIILESAFGGFFFTTYAVYTFRDGAVQPLEINEDFGGRPSSLSVFSPPGNAPGIIVNGGGEGFARHMLITMDGNSLNIDVCLTASALPRDRGYDYILFYVRGAEVAPVELPDFLYWLTEEHKRMIYEGYALVSREDFYEVRDDIFGVMPERERTSIHSIANVNYAFLP